VVVGLGLGSVVGWDGYPYGYYGGYGYGDYGYGNGYGQYGDASHSRVEELQGRLARAGYYHGSIDGILGPQTRRAIRAYERDHNMPG
jgi:Putative peptidoglycan binding domain